MGTDEKETGGRDAMLGCDPRPRTKERKVLSKRVAISLLGPLLLIVRVIPGAYSRAPRDRPR